MCKIFIQPPVWLEFHRPVCKLPLGCHFGGSSGPIDLKFSPETKIIKIN